ncbi:MAG TPA: ferrous iron transporter A [Hungateiclostridium thermocellum]|jgi:chitodextrinase|uniref:S-layer domain-containing protein n=2 Tax=Acetivibrio thermocellus TaxID=1515 RepID=A3DI77_ACET2|nr:fibronectin type III domain-containing protein [Acetivibrio thermocellus]CDG36976.1 fibronectin, type III [Acetivibrio thermocellus BC1]ABN53656.1 S-layer domain-containing protein [Acetivibrio thermocellus ATCC 27405]ADU73182.1 S-layer domain-containing protein [Acetivibrio thermocellus DSM 1313]ALX07096.1 S-layer domain-containing protein [Acetivibrio thermocellus AD2]ANV74832.1 S-layer domain-containing protein [Acetivibrio thermocellus DSM 2360]
MKLIIDYFKKLTVFILIILITTFCLRNTALADFTLHAAPADFNSDTQINLNWTSVTNAVYYSIVRNDVHIANIDIDLVRNYLSFQDTGLVPQTSYSYTVTAVDSNGRSIKSASSTVSTLQMKAPSIVSSCLDINTNEITLTWTNNSLAVNGTIVNKSGEGQIAEVSGKNTSVTFVDPNLTYGVEAQYTIMSIDGNGHSSPSSDPVSIIPIVPPVIEASIKNSTVTISWQPHDHIHEFRLERAKYLEDKKKWGSWEIIKTSLAKNSTSTTDSISSDGTYRYRLSIDNGKYKGYSNISNPVARLLAPTNIQCVPVDSGRIDISWSLPSKGNFTLKIEKRIDSGSYYTLAVLDSNITSYSDTEGILPNKYYYYRITAYDENGNSASSPVYSIYTGKPSAASNLMLEITSPTKITLNWKDSSSNESGFRIERKVDTGTFVPIATLPANTTSYVDNNVNPQSTYTYRVMSFNSIGDASSYSNEVSCTTSILKGPPSSLTVTPLSANEIELGWTYAGSASYSTIIERKTGDGSTWEMVTTLPAGYTSYRDTDLLPNTRYFYRVRTNLASRVYSRPYPEKADDTGVYTYFETPEKLTSAWTVSGFVKLSWKYEPWDDEEIIIERKTGNGKFIEIGRQDADKTVWYDYDTDPETDYTYRIKAVNAYNSSEYSNESSVDAISFKPPENLSATIVSNTEIILSWTDMTEDESGFRVEMKEGNSENWKKVVSLSKNTTSYTIKELKPDTLYHFRVVAEKSAYRFEVYSEEIQVLMKSLAAPSNLVVRAVSPNQIVLEWKDNSDDEEGFVIERKSNNGDFTEIAKVAKNITKFTDNQLYANTTYYYRVKGYYKNTYTNYTNIGMAKTALSKTFNDLNSVPWAKEAIESLAARGIIHGKSEEQGIFAPNDRITRAEFITLIVNAFQLSKTPTGTFADVKPNHWYYRNVMIAKNMGIVSGTGNNYFYPDDPIKREDMAVILAKTFKIIGKPLPNHSDSVLDKYSDKNLISIYALQSMAILNGEGIITGKSSSQLSPKDYATRAEAAVILYKALNKL